MKKNLFAGLALLFIVFSISEKGIAADLQGVWEGTITCISYIPDANNSQNQTFKIKQDTEMSIVNNTTSSLPDYYVFMRSTNYSLHTGESESVPGTGEGILVACDTVNPFEDGFLNIAKIEFDLVHGSKDTIEGSMLNVSNSDVYGSSECAFNVTRVSNVPAFGIFTDCHSYPPPYTP